MESAAQARLPIGAPSPARLVKLPPLAPEVRRQRLEAATAHLKRQGVLVSVVDREAQIRRYRVSGRRESKLAEEVIEIAIEHGLELPA